MIKIRLARYKDKPGVDCTKYRQEAFEETEEQGIVDISTSGKWCYHAWVEEGDFEEPEWDRFNDSNSGTKGISRFRPEAHDVEMIPDLIELPVALENLVMTFNLYDQDFAGAQKGFVNDFLFDLKLMLLEVWARGLGDNEAIIFLKDEDAPTPLFAPKQIAELAT